MGWWKEVPYRGDGKSKNNKPRRRFVNIKKNRRETTVSIIIIFAIFVIPFGCLFVFGKSPYGDDISDTSSAIVGLILILTLIVGIVSISKFRKGYDIEAPDEPEDKKDQPSKEHKNIIDK
jgi:hypothetical protein